VRVPLPARRAFRLAPFLAAFGLVLSGCTLLVDFVTKDQSGDPTCDGGLCLDATFADVQVEGSSPDAAPEAASIDAPFEKSPNDVHVEVAQCANPCRNRDNGWYCGNNGLFCNAPPDDLYFCEKDAVGDVTHCTSGCVPLPNGHPDTCDPCFGKADGTYCGKDFPTVPHVAGVDHNDIYLFDCKAGMTTTASQACPTACSGTPPNSKCS
jgi:hypothetical protein